MIGTRQSNLPHWSNLLLRGVAAGGSRALFTARVLLLPWKSINGWKLLIIFLDFPLYTFMYIYITHKYIDINRSIHIYLQSFPKLQVD